MVIRGIMETVGATVGESAMGHLLSVYLMPGTIFIYFKAYH
jgi:hypothetical protein